MKISPNTFYKLFDLFIGNPGQDITIGNYNIKQPSKIKYQEGNKIINTVTDIMLIQNLRNVIREIEFEISGFSENPPAMYKAICSLTNIGTQPNRTDKELMHFVSFVSQFDIANMKKTYM